MQIARAIEVVPKNQASTDRFLSEALGPSNNLPSWNIESGGMWTSTYSKGSCDALVGASFMVDPGSVRSTISLSLRDRTSNSLMLA